VTRPGGEHISSRRGLRLPTRAGVRAPKASLGASLGAALRPVRGPALTLVLALAGLVLPASGSMAAGEAAARATPAHPQRIVSLNLCTDQILWDVAPRRRIAALTRLAADPTLSTIAGEVAGVRLVRGEAEEVLALAPDLVVASDWTTPATIALLGRLGHPVLVVPQATSPRGIADAVTLIATAIGEGARGRALLARFNARLDAVAAAVAALVPGRRRPTALLYQVGGLVEGAGSLTAEMFRLAGFEPARGGGRAGFTGVSLEDLVVAPPDLLVLGHAASDYRTTAADNLRHPALSQALRGRPTLVLPQPLWLCGTPRWIEGVERLAAARSTLDHR
jgi:iron complex transport system substrate-binding protein